MEIYRELNKLPTFKSSTVLTIGSFDGVHQGHQRLLHKLKTLANEIGGQSLVITFQPHPRQIIYPKDKSLRLLTTMEEKIRYIAAEAIDCLVIIPFTVEFSQLQPREYIESFLLKRFNPRYIVIGYDHRFGLNREGNLKLLKTYELPGHLEIIEIDKQSVEEIVVSSTKIRNAVLNGDVQLANKLLNHPYPIYGTVVHGEKIGSKLGFPTANIQVENEFKLIPKYGIYAATIQVEESIFQGLLYVGKRPSVSDLEEVRLEMHIFDYNEVIYGKEVLVELHQYLRADEAYDSLEDLKTQMLKDEEKARLFFTSFSSTGLFHKTESVAIVVLNYNGEQYLKKFLPSVVAHTPPYAKIYVIDNGSTDGSIKLLATNFPSVNIIKLDENYGYAGGYNLGLLEIKADYFYLINSDIEVKERWLQPLYDACQADPKIAACQPKILSYNEPDKFEYAGGAGGFIDKTFYPFCMGRLLNDIEIDRGQYDIPKEIFWASGAALFIRANIFEKLGGFDASYFAHQEEIDLCWRIKRAGYKIVSCPQAIVYHLGGGTLTYESPRKTFLNFKNNLTTIYKNIPILKFLLLLPLRLLLDSAASFNYFIKGQGKNALQVLKAYIAFILSIGEIRATKKLDDKRISKIVIGEPNLTGHYRGSILVDYYFLKRKTFLLLKYKTKAALYEGQN